MRSSSRNIVSGIGLGILGVSYLIGTQSASAGLATANNAEATTSTASPTPTPTDTPSATSSPSSSASQSSSTTKTTTTKKKSPSSSSSGSVSKTGSTSYRYGTIQLTVTKKSGKITAVDYSGSTASAGRDAAFPYLVKYAIAENGSNFTNQEIGFLSGATFTMQAFQQALDNALGKF